MKPPIQRWSFSSLREYERCPYALYLGRVEKAPRPEIDDDPKHPLVRGSRVHKEAELYIIGEGPLTKDLRKLKAEFEELRAKYDEHDNIEVEQIWAFDKEWGRTDPAWDNPEHWATIICDVVEHEADGKHIRVTDWKTGKSFGKEVAHTQQMQLYAIAAFMRYPKADLVSARLGYLDEGKLKSKQYTREAVTRLMQTWQKRGATLTNAMVFKPKPNRGNCRFCPYSPNPRVGTGACAYGVPWE